jgi:hypothetical protein
MHSQRLDRSGILAAEETKDHDVMIIRKSGTQLETSTPVLPHDEL